MGCDLPHPERSARGPEPQVERPVGKWSPRISRKHELRSREGNPAGSQDAAAFKAFLDRLPLEERRTQSPGYRHILEDASLAFDPEGHNFFFLLPGNRPMSTGSVHRTGRRSGRGRWPGGTRGQNQARSDATQSALVCNNRSYCGQSA
jgi:hypothetical protein